MIRLVVLAACWISAPFLVSKYRTLCTKCDKVQFKLLMKFIKSNANSHFGRKHKFAEIKSIDDFKRNVPISNYSAFEPYIQAVREGEIQALFNAKEKIIAFHLSSGTTATPKYIPVTSTFYKHHKNIWLYYYSYLLTRNPKIFRGKIFPFYSPVSEFYTDLGIPCGSDSGLIAEKQSKFLSHSFAVPSEAYKINTMDEKYYALIRFAIQADVSFIIGSNPIIMLYMGRILNSKKEQLIEEVRQGTIDESLNIPENIKNVLRKKAKRLKDPKRGTELERIMRETGTLRPVDIWPKLCAVATWKGGTLNLPLELFPNYFGDIPIWALGLHSSEGRYTITLDAEGSWGCLAITNNFYEFIPEEQIESPAQETKLAHELVIGKRYVLVITTASGFYRYNLEDLIECVGHYGNSPMIRFLNKSSQILDLQGAKIYEYQLVDAVRLAIRKHHRYVQYFQFHPTTNKFGQKALAGIFEHQDGIGHPEWRTFLETTDKALQKINPDYGTLRSAGKLGVMDLKLVPEHTFENIKRERIKTSGIRLVEQFKHKYMIEDPFHHEQFVILNTIEDEVA